MNQLANAALNTDNRFAVAYSGRTDERERRALFVAARLHLDAGRRKNPVGARVLMLTIEDMRPEA